LIGASSIAEGTEDGSSDTASPNANIPVYATKNREERDVALYGLAHTSGHDTAYKQLATLTVMNNNYRR